MDSSRAESHPHELPFSTDATGKIIYCGDCIDSRPTWPNGAVDWCAVCNVTYQTQPLCHSHQKSRASIENWQRLLKMQKDAKNHEQRLV